MNNLPIDSLVEAVLRIDDLKKDHLVRIGVEREAKPFAQADAVHFYFYNEQKKVLYRPITREHYELFHNQVGLLSEMAYKQSHGLIEGNRLFALESSLQPPQVRAGRPRTNNVYVSPILDPKRTHGLLVAFNINKTTFKPEAFDSFAKMLAIAIRRYKILNPDIQRVRENKSVTTLNQFLFRTRSKSGFFEKVVDLLHRQLRAERISIILRNSQNSKYEFAAGRSIEPEILLNGVVTLEDNVLSWILKNREGLLCPNITADRRFGRNKTLRYKKQSFMAFPIVVVAELVGFLSLADKADRVAFDRKDFNVAQSLVLALGQGLAFLRSVESPTTSSAPAPNSKAAKPTQTPFGEHYQEWLSEQKDFGFGENTFSSPNNLPMVGLGQHGQAKAPSYVMSVVHVVGEVESSALEHKNSLESILNYAIKHHANPKDVYKLFRRECIRFVERKSPKEAPIKLPMWLLGKEKNRLAAYIATEDYVCLHFNSRSQNINLFRLENELAVDYTDSRIQEKLIYYHSGDVLVVYSNSANNEALNLSVKKAIQRLYSEDAETIRNKLLDKGSVPFEPEGSFYVFKML